MADVYVRITPVDHRKGAFCRRYTVGGRTFEAGRWYTMAQEWAAKLEKLEQPSGAPVFQIVDRAEYERIARAELAATVAAAGGPVVSAPAAPPPRPEPKKGPRASAFEGLAVSEVEDGQVVADVAASVAAEESDPLRALEEAAPPEGVVTSADVKPAATKKRGSRSGSKRRSGGSRKK